MQRETQWQGEASDRAEAESCLTSVSEMWARPPMYAGNASLMRSSRVGLRRAARVSHVTAFISERVKGARSALTRVSLSPSTL